MALKHSIWHWSKLRCAVSIKQTPDFEDLVGTKECKISQYFFMLIICCDDSILDIRLNILLTLISPLFYFNTETRYFFYF